MKNGYRNVVPHSTENWLPPLHSLDESHGLECWPFHYIDYIIRRGGQLSISMWLPATGVGQQSDANRFTFDGAIENCRFGTNCTMHKWTNGQMDK